MLKKIIFSGILLFFVLSCPLIAQTIIKDDFRVNDDYDIGGSSQKHPAIAMDHNGNFVVVWLDERNADLDIYGQRFDRFGNPLCDNFKVNDTKFIRHINYVDVAMDSDGDFVVVWQDSRNNKYDIYAQIYNSTGSPVGSNFQVNNDILNSSHYFPSISMTPSGEFIVTWIIRLENDFYIYGQRYSAKGGKIYDNFEIVNLQKTKFDPKPPSVAINPKGDFVVTWGALIYNQDMKETHSEIHAIRISSKNEILCSEFKVNDSDSLASPANPDVAIDACGDFVITWLEGTSGLDGIFAQKYSFKGEALGSNFKVNSTGRSFIKFPKVTMNLSKEFTIAWVELRDMLNIYIQHYNHQGEPVGNNLKVTDFGQTWGPTNIDIAGNPSGCLALVWDRYECTSDNEIFVTLLNNKMEIVQETVKADYDYGSSSQKNPAITASSSDRFAISWNDIRLCNKDVFTQKFNSSGEFLGLNSKVNQQSYGSSSSISMDSTGNSVIAFLGNDWIYVQRYDYNGGKLGENTFVNDEPMPPYLFAPDVAMGLQGDFVVVWPQFMVPASGIFAQLFDTHGNKLDSNFIVNEYLYSPEFSRPVKISKSDNGNFVVVWEAPCYYTNQSEIWGQLYNSSGDRIGDNFMISDSTVSLSNYYPDVGMDQSGNFVVSWFGAGNILIQRFTADGSKIGAIIKAIDFSGMKPSELALTVKSNGEFLVAWQDYRNDNLDIYAQRFDAEGNPLGDNFRVNSDEGDNVQQSPVVAADDKNYYFAWV
ncbi:MAG: hypothetical protein OEV55_02660, partial [candidate division Zixibacteria bacterium]|nr:hypothetical protein [candidate division Zixibacteria bacterium]